MSKLTLPSVVQLDSQPIELDRDSEADGEKKARTFTMSAYTGAAFMRGFGGAVLDLAGLEFGQDIPILRQHDGGKFVGRSTSIESDGETLTVHGRLFDGVAEANEVALIADQGGRWQASVGFAWDDGPDSIGFLEPGETQQINGREFEGPLVVFRRGQLNEVSFVPIGADSSTSAEVLEHELKETVMSTTKTDAGDGVNEERARTRKIRQLFPRDHEFALEAIDQGWSPTEAKAEYADRLSAKLADAEKATEVALEAERKRTEELEERLAKAEEKLSKPSPASLLGGNATGSQSDSEDASAIGRWEQALSAELKRLKEEEAPGMRRGGQLVLSGVANLRAKAVATLAARDPELHRAYLDEFNSRGLGRKRNRRGR